MDETTLAQALEPFFTTAADRADDDAGALSRRLDGDVGRTVAQICDEVHALIGQRPIQPVRRAGRDTSYA